MADTVREAARKILDDRYNKDELLEVYLDLLEELGLESHTYILEMNK